MTCALHLGPVTAVHRNTLEINSSELAPWSVIPMTKKRKQEIDSKTSDIQTNQTNPSNLFTFCFQAISEFVLFFL